ncbi:VanW family protein [Cohnella herbarum]|uniref:VanW family protein n=1 Tax=Cohnella herbarum TaxID=2728023 RepID=A0A7Z2ZPB0_9BACL|nr:VanW family protein [Cohnella herbarum]QJD87261.1 VanW family protein [Cohnella herbarum]
MSEVRTKPLIKYLGTRLLLDDAHSVLRGWYFRFSKLRKAEALNTDSDCTLSEIIIQMKWREDLQEVNHSRFHNMGLGCELVNHVIVRSGEVFSLRRYFGGTTEEQGFRKGPMFVRGRIEYVAGGGACLISTLLFNAALRANLAILEKHNHSTDLWGEERFIGLGLDATYLYGRKDLKFKNTHGADIRIEIGLSREDLMLHCRFVSSKPLPYTVSVISEVLQELHPEAVVDGGDLSEDNRPYRKGWVVRTERTVIEEGLPNSKTYSKEESYKPFYLPKA